MKSRLLSRRLKSLSRVYGFLVALSALLLLSGCASFSSNFAKVENAAATRNIDVAIQTLDQLKLDGANQVLHHLNKASLLRMQGNYTESNAEFDQAKRLMEEMSAVSVTEQAGSVIVNERMKSYEGLPNEQLSVYSLAALNYLQMNDLDAAAVEARQFDVQQGLIASKYPEAKYLSGAFERYLNAMVYQSAGEMDSARIEMEKAVEGYTANSSFGVPRALTEDLARIAEDKRVKSEVVFVLHNGLGPTMEDFTIRVPNPNPMAGSAILSLAVPKLVKRPVPVSRVVLSSDSKSTTSEVVEDVNDTAEKSLSDRLPAITARAVARMVAKNLLAGQAKERSAAVAGPFSFLADMAIDAGAAISESADTRTWALLPGNIHMARLSLPAGEHTVTATYYGEGGMVIGVPQEYKVTVKPGKKTFISDYVLN